jgi:hypothetical protein
LNVLRPGNISVVVALALGGCLTSQEPLIGEDDAAFPLEPGSVVEAYGVADNGAMTPELDADGATVTHELELLDGWYRDGTSSHPTDGVAGGRFVYSLFEQRSDLFVHYAFSRKAFEAYLAGAERAARFGSGSLARQRRRNDHRAAIVGFPGGDAAGDGGRQLLRSRPVLRHRRPCSCPAGIRLQRGRRSRSALSGLQTALLDGLGIPCVGPGESSPAEDHDRGAVARAM